MINFETIPVNLDVFLRFLKDESGSTTADTIVIAAFVVANGLAFMYDTLTQVAELGDDLQLCMKRQGNILKGGGRNADRDYQERLARIKNRCGSI